MLNFYKKRGITLLEVVLAVVLLAVVVVPLFGFLFSHSRIDERLAVKNELRDTAKDVKSFVRLTNYETMLNLARNDEFLVVSEEDDDDLVSRNFQKLSQRNPNSRILVKFERANPSSLQFADSDSCVLPLCCKIFHLKRPIIDTDIQKSLRTCDAELIVPYVVWP